MLEGVGSKLAETGEGPFLLEVSGGEQPCESPAGGSSDPFVDAPLSVLPLFRSTPTLILSIPSLATTRFTGVAARNLSSPLANGTVATSRQQHRPPPAYC
jgi:hypothetical protein